MPIRGKQAGWRQAAVIAIVSVLALIVLLLIAASERVLLPVGSAAKMDCVSNARVYIVIAKQCRSCALRTSTPLDATTSFPVRLGAMKRIHYA